MSSGEVVWMTVPVLGFLIAAHVLGHVFVRFRQPRVIGEILAGCLLGPSVLGQVAPSVSRAIFGGQLQGSNQRAVLDSVYWFGLLLLMFVSGAGTRHLFCREDRSRTAVLALFGTGLPFLFVLGAGPFLPVESIMGPAHQRMALILVVGIAVAVTSIPVISRIFHDLGILHTRFASVVLGIAVIEDIALWAVLAIATALAQSAGLEQQEVLAHVGASLVYFCLGLTVVPALLKRLNAVRWNILASASPVAYVVVVLFVYAAVAATFNVSPVFAAFLAGFALRTGSQPILEALDAVSKFSFAVFIPVYFALVGYRLDLSKSFSASMLVTVLAAACAIKVLSVAVGARLVGFSPLDTVNLSIATNARGGPGIVLASVAFDAKIVNAPFYTTLVLVAILTSQAAGAWLQFVLRKGWPLLSVDEPMLAPSSEKSPTARVAA
ncbi:MAG: cation:proton antiporter [Acidobacteria bacterium]|nr:MAG: cation:proton antiporter [Acidobacteriota bacterium]